MSNTKKVTISLTPVQQEKARACEGSCEIHKGEVIPVIIEGHGWDGIKFNYCQEAIKEDERRGFIVRHERY